MTLTPEQIANLFKQIQRNAQNSLQGTILYSGTSLTVQLDEPYQGKTILENVIAGPGTASPVSVPLRGRGFESMFTSAYQYYDTYVSVPLRGRGFESSNLQAGKAQLGLVSVPLRGRGFESPGAKQVAAAEVSMFPSPCGEEVLNQALAILLQGLYSTECFRPLAGKRF